MRYDATMKKVLIILAILLIILGAVYFFFFTAKMPNTLITGTPGLPVAGSQLTPVGSEASTTTSAAEVTVAARGTDQPIVVNDFVHNGTTAPDPSNTGNYYLAGMNGSDFAISYNATSQFFTIALNKEPIGTARLEAEQFLLKALGIPEAQLCNINYYLGTDVYTNSLYAGKNLGFSFCPGATALP